MKKIILVLLILSCFMLICSCGEHTHEKAKEFSSNDTQHWYACTGRKCMERLEIAEHIWDEGKITKKPTYREDGVKAYTCTICERVKLEPVKYEPKTTVKDSEWKNAFDKHSFDNVRIVFEEVIESQGTAFKTVYTIEANNRVVYLQTVNYENEVEKSYSAVFQDDVYQWALTSKDQVIEDVLFEIVPTEDLISAGSVFEREDLNFSQLYSSFTYNSEKKVYEAANLQIGEFTVKSASISIADGKIAKVSVSYDETDIEHYIEIDFSKYSEADPTPPSREKQ